jgi:hypothetical protein
MTERQKELLTKAKKAEKLAKKSKDAAFRDQWLKIAETYRQLATERDEPHSSTGSV